ncbi:MAG: hypothetical protein IPM69_01685 [Ignavibacteria bacterium]|nr:hypothetical protein [Ignavibacteria bacterium]
MKIRQTSGNGLILLLFTMFSFVFLPFIADAKGSFGGSRGGGGRSFGGSRGGGGSFGGSRSKSYSRPSTPSYGKSSPSRSYSTPKSSFGGNRLNSKQDYTRSYGVPRQSTPMQLRNSQGANQNYVVHNYGGRGDGFMMGYMMGSIPFMWHTPFHPAYYYSRPSYVTNPDGTVEVYPPTFSYGTLFFTILIVGGIIFVIVLIIKRRRKGYDSNFESNSSFS